jgi:sphingomyelin phosphodiesterase
LYRSNDHFQKPRGSDKEYIKIALMSDLHMDFDYTVGMSNDCGKPLCCRSDSGLPQMNGQAAQKWGDYKCDLN